MKSYQFILLTILLILIIVLLSVNMYFNGYQKFYV